jgi:hypothetical protein
MWRSIQSFASRSGRLHCQGLSLTTQGRFQKRYTDVPAVFCDVTAVQFPTSKFLYTANGGSMFPPKRRCSSTKLQPQLRIVPSACSGKGVECVNSVSTASFQNVFRKWVHRINTHYSLLDRCDQLSRTSEFDCNAKRLLGSKNWLTTGNKSTEYPKNHKKHPHLLCWQWSAQQQNNGWSRLADHVISSWFIATSHERWR